MIKPLKINELYNKCDTTSLKFTTTAQLKNIKEIIGQDRALNAINVALGIDYEGYNLFVMGNTGTGRHSLIKKLIFEKSKKEKTANDWCYVNNFDDLNKPISIELPAGYGLLLKENMDKLVETLKTQIPLIFSSQQYLTKKQNLENTLKNLQDKDFYKIKEKAKEENVFINYTNKGITLSPLKEGKVLTSEEYQSLKIDEREKLDKKILEYTDIVDDNAQKEVERNKEYLEKFNLIEDKFIDDCVSSSMKKIKNKFNKFPEVLLYLENVQEDILTNFQDFIPNDSNASGNIVENIMIQNLNPTPTFGIYNVNVLVSNKKNQGSPIIYEDNPTYSNLFGQIEHISHMGTLTTDFNLIKAGSLHEANGGYLIIDARALMFQPYAWEGLKRMLISKNIHLETIEESMGLSSSVSLKPKSIKLNIKIVLVGPRSLYYMLYNYDPDFKKLFKIEADFEDEISRNDENIELYANMIASIAKQNAILPLTKTAVGKVIEYCSRMVDDTTKLSTNLSGIMDLLQEVNYIAKKRNAKTIKSEDIVDALKDRVQRTHRIQQLIYDEIKSGTIQIQTSGEAVGQINGLSIIDMGNHSFSTPVKISALARMGRQGVVDIEREVNLSGAIHSKGVMILSSYLASKYASNFPLSLSATLVFEQSYSIIDGDSATLAELYTLLSSIAKVPIKQNFAITGSMNQNGDVQAIGGVNEKIEGFFDVCKLIDEDFHANVIIPHSNVKNLMLKEEILEAVKKGKFKVYAIKHIEEGVNLLMGLNAGVRNKNGKFPKNSLNYLVETKLDDFSKTNLKTKE